MILKDTGFQEGRTVCFRKGQAKAVLRLLHAGGSKTVRKIRSPLPVYVIAAAVYVRPHDHAEVPRLTAVQGRRKTEGFNGNPRPLPARMQDAGHPADRIVQEHRHAVCNRNDRNQGPVTGYEPVPLLSCCLGSRSNRIYLTGMDKLKGNGFVSVRRKPGKKGRSVFVPFIPAETHAPCGKETHAPLRGLRSGRQGRKAAVF